MGIWLDLKTAFRQCRRAPGTAAAAVLTLAVGIGATTAMFSFLAAVHVGRLAGRRHGSAGRALVAQSQRSRDEERRSRPATSSNGGAARRSLDSVDRDAPRLGQPRRPRQPGARRRRSSSRRTTSTSSAGSPPLGRGVRGGDGVPGAPRVVVVSYTVLARLAGVARRRRWRHGRPPRRRTGDDRRRAAADAGRRRHLRAAARRGAGRDHATRTLFVFARLRTGVSIEQARAEMDTIGAALEREFPAHQSRLDGQHAAAAGRVRRSAGAPRLCASSPAPCWPCC